MEISEAHTQTHSLQVQIADCMDSLGKYSQTVMMINWTHSCYPLHLDPFFVFKYIHKGPNT